MKKIMVVDDAPSVRQQVSMVLVQGGYEPIAAVDGQEALHRVAVSGADMVVLDLNMPRMNGLDFLDQLRADSKTSHIPVLILTAEGNPALVERARKAGAKGWIVKPFKADLLLAAVRKILGG